MYTFPWNSNDFKVSDLVTSTDVYVKNVIVFNFKVMFCFYLLACRQHFSDKI